MGETGLFSPCEFARPHTPQTALQMFKPFFVHFVDNIHTQADTQTSLHVTLKQLGHTA